MQITITWQSFITAAAFVGAVIALVTYFSKIVRWVDKQSKQDEEIKQIKKHHEEDVKAIEKHHEEDIKSIKEEQSLLVEGVLACLKGLQEKGCNGPVTQAIKQYEDYLNQKAHK